MRNRPTTPYTVIVLLAIATVVGALGASGWRVVPTEAATTGTALGVLVGVVGAAVTIACALAVFIATKAGDEERDLLERRLHFLIDHDPLTGLPNRRRFERELDRHVAMSRRYQRGAAVLVVDLDRLETINESLGNEAGDQLITDVAAAMRDRLRDSDFIARTGGDEFAVLLPEADRPGAIAVADAMLSEIRRETVTLRESGVSRLTASVGVALLDEITPLSSGQIMIAAERAMREAKDSGRDGLTVFDGDRSVKTTEPPPEATD